MEKTKKERAALFEAWTKHRGYLVLSKQHPYAYSTETPGPGVDP